MAIVNDTPKRFTATNDVTGTLIKTKADNQDAFAEGWERIFGKKKKEESVDEQQRDEDQQ